MVDTQRNYEAELEDNSERKYSYIFDDILRKYTMRTFEPYYPKGKALEMGCYKGEITEILTNYFADITVLEAVPSLIRETEIRVGNKVKFIKGTFEEASVPGIFDAIFLMHTLEHLEDPIKILKRIKSWLSPKGYLFLVVPNANAPSRQIAVKMGLISHNTGVTKGEFDHGHRCTYTFDTLERDVKQGGLSVIHRGGVFFKCFANFQFDKLIKNKIINEDYLEGCYQLGMQYPELCASIYLICGKGK